MSIGPQSKEAPALTIDALYTRDAFPLVRGVQKCGNQDKTAFPSTLLITVDWRPPAAAIARRHMEQQATKEEHSIVPASASFTLDEGLEAVGFGRFQLVLLILSGIGFCATTAELISVSLLRAPLRASFPYVQDQLFGYAMSATFAGELLGGLGWGLVGDKLGRRWPFVGTALMAAIFGMLGAFVPCFYTFLITRFALGLAIGGSLAIDFVYFVEFVPAAKRGFRTTFIILLGIMAFFYVALVGWLTLPRWRYFVFFCGAPYGLLFIGRSLWCWESPRFLLAQGRTSESFAILQLIARINRTRLPPGTLLPPMATGSAADKSSQAARAMLIPTATVSILFFCQTFSYYGLTVWLRNFATARGITNLDPVLAFLLIGLAELPGLALTTFLIERAGRRAVMLINFAGAALCSALLLTVRDRRAFLAVYSASYFFIVGCWTAIYVCTPELFPTTWRARAFATAGAFGKAAGIISPILFGRLWSSQAPFLLIVGFVSGGFLLAALTAAALLMETRGLQLADR